jgi:hypothetical protein
LRAFRFVDRESLCSSSTLSPVVLSFPLLGIQCAVAYILALSLRFRVAPGITKENRTKMINQQHHIHSMALQREQLRLKKRADAKGVSGAESALQSDGKVSSLETQFGTDFEKSMFFMDRICISFFGFLFCILYFKICILKFVFLCFVFLFLYFCIFVFLYYICICVFVFLCFCVFVFLCCIFHLIFISTNYLFTD